MHLYQQLQRDTAADRSYLLAAPATQGALVGDITRELYIEFLTQAYHHVGHTVPLMMAVGAGIPARHAWLQESILHYLDEERGHEQWILNDIEHAGGDRAAAAASQPSLATECLVAYAYDTIQRRNPLGFFGMVFVLEGTSVALALDAADRIQSTLQLPARAFSYLRSHGELDQQHVGDLELAPLAPPPSPSSTTTVSMRASTIPHRALPWAATPARRSAHSACSCSSMPPTSGPAGFPAKS